MDFLIYKFLYLWKPDKIFLVDSEIWPNLIFKTKKYKIPIALINARLTSKSFSKWMFFPSTAKKIFSTFNVFICSNTETKNYLKKLNLKNVYFKGNIKFADQINIGGKKSINKNFLDKKKFWFAASTHKDENIFCLETHLNLKEKYKNKFTIIAPRHLERSKVIENLSKKLGLNSKY